MSREELYNCWFKSLQFQNNAGDGDLLFLKYKDIDSIDKSDLKNEEQFQLLFEAYKRGYKFLSPRIRATG